MKRSLLLLCVLALPGIAHAWDSVPNYSRQQSDRNAQNMKIIDDMQRQASERDQEWRRRDDEQRRRDADERQRNLRRRDDERRRENARLQDERARDWGQRQAHEEQRMERFNYELLQRDEQQRKGGKGGSYREPEYRGKPLNPKELRRYELLKPGERP